MKTTKSILFDAINAFLVSIGINVSVSWDAFEKLTHMVRVGRKVDAIKLLRVETTENISPMVDNSDGYLNENDFMTWLQNTGSPLTKNVRVLGLREAKHILDVVQRASF